MNNFVRKGIVGLSLVLLLSACSNGNTTSSNSSSVKDKKTVSETTKTSKTETSQSSTQKQTEKTKQTDDKKVSWTEKQASDLKQFMSSWGSTMGQAYKEYNKESSVNFYGLSIPSGLLEGQMHPKINNEFVEMSWLEANQKEDSYTILTVYSDIETTLSVGGHCYLFTVHKDRPVVLVTMQNQGNAENAIVFKETENQELKKGFNQIIEGTFVPQQNQSEEQVSHQDLDAATRKTIELLKGTYYKGVKGEPAFTIDDMYYTDLVMNKKYKIASIASTEEEQTVYTIAWDTTDFEQRYGAGSIGPGPQPFIYKLVVGIQGKNFALEDLSGQTYTQTRME
ncbi:DUF4767 domain-containing protein [Enterococcus caccae]|uniref:DUF4767 domain-containing protein n=1 Tax=Enterococcus caccae ATCC BAA-1240 TaxID=1158612 RepID=R3TSL2_9ENTE|nr:DUF4767 domain-containing protein [Enterococcus caccae]EOL44539.1 hypothetical protein UC7_02082 [Enterococcus caccae ATCC BAA-1240]EOT58682.1 hypothetical protein I580_02854 [Enterococcus caccae ATCC BAA-1240]